MATCIQTIMKKIPERFYAINTPFFKISTNYSSPKCPSFLQLEDVFCFCGLYFDLLLRFRHNKQVSRTFREVGLLLIVFTWNEPLELNCNCTNIYLKHLNSGCSVYYTCIYFNFHVAIVYEHQPCIVWYAINQTFIPSTFCFSKKN